MSENTAYLLDLDTVKKKSIFWGYISLWCLQGLCIYGTRDEEGNRAYNATIVIGLTEFAKLFISLSLYISYDYDFSKGLPPGWMKLFGLYLIPAFLYCIYNNLTYVCLSRMNAPTYYLLMQLRLLVTAVVWKILFKKDITTQQWSALAMITFGCIVKEIGGYHGNSEEEERAEQSSTIINVFLVGVQILASTFAGVYTEYLLKDYNSMSTNLQNVFMYVNSIAANVCLLLLSPKTEKLRDSNLSFDAVMTILLNPITLFLVVNGACTGVLTAFFLSNLDSMRKTIAAALEINIIAFISWLIFHTDLGPSTILSAGLVSYGVYFYSAKPREVKVPSPRDES